MKGKIERKSKLKEKYEKRLDNIMPRDFDILKVIVKGKKIIVDMREIMEISNLENKQEIVSCMNQVSSYFSYFGRVAIDLNDQLNKEQEIFTIWMSHKKSKFTEEDSEKARERCVITKYTEEYNRRKERIRKLTLWYDYARNAKSSLEKNIELIRSIASFIKSESQNNSNFDFKNND